MNRQELIKAKQRLIEEQKNKINQLLKAESKAKKRDELAAARILFEFLKSNEDFRNSFKTSKSWVEFVKSKKLSTKTIETLCENDLIVKKKPITHSSANTEA